MKNSLTLPRAALGLALALAACAQRHEAGAARATRASPRSESPGPAVAEFAGQKVTQEELDRRLGPRLTVLRQQEYDLRRQAIDELVDEKLLEKEAAARGLSTADLLKAEVDDKVAAPSEKEIDEVFERNKGRLGGRSKEEVRPEIEQALRQRNRSARREAFRRELAARSEVRVLLQPPRAEVKIPPDAPTLGPARAPVTIVEFTDYECPYCQRAQSTVDQLLSRNAGKVRFVHRDFPIEGHSYAVPASRAARCAGEQGKFWEYHRGLLQPSRTLTLETLRVQARSLGLKAEVFSTCLASDRHDGAIRASVAEGNALGVSATPTFFVNGRMVVGARSLEDFQRIIDEEIAAPR